MKLDSSVSAVITGGASGLGAATARSLAAKGVKVAIFDLQAEKGEALAKELGGVFCEVNVTDDASVDAGFAKSRAAIGQERILVNCAGTGNAIKTASRSKEDGSIKHFPLDAFNWLVQINLVGTFRCIAKSAAGMMTLPAMEDGERGAIVNTASVAAEDGQMGQAAYSASKGGVVGMTLPIARDLASENIRVNTILPGIFDTPLLAGAPQNVRDALGATVLNPKRLGNPAEYANLALCMIENGYFNGEDVRLDGGIRMSPR
jgi:NAD(P)-dependent dehydrogenase (short-subunit alcohol dehydrogenase family)